MDRALQFRNDHPGALTMLGAGMLNGNMAAIGRKYCHRHWCRSTGIGTRSERLADRALAKATS